MKRTGIMGGTFNPVHSGHVSLAKDAFVQAELDQVIFIPAKTSPFKIGENTAPASDRAAMLLAAVKDLGSGFSVSEIEMNMQGVSYTYRTLRELRKCFGNETEIFFITGTDTYVTLEKWRNSAEVLENTSFIVGSRPGYEDERLKAAARKNSEKFGTKTLIIQNKKLDISSTEIREKAKRGESLAGLVPAGVEQYINEHGLYR